MPSAGTATVCQTTAYVTAFGENLITPIDAHAHTPGEPRLAVEQRARRHRDHQGWRTRVSQNDPVVRDGFVHQTPLARLGEPHEIATFVGFLLSDDAALVTGPAGFADTEIGYHQTGRRRVVSVLANANRATAT